MSRPAASIVSPQAIAKQVKLTLGQGDGPTTADKLVTGHLFLGACDWYITEYDKDDDMAFGYCHLGDDQCAEWGYVSIAELRQTKQRIVMRVGNKQVVMGYQHVEWDRHWTPKKASEIDRIVKAGGCW